MTRQRQRRGRKPVTRTEERLLTIESLGPGGDGLAENIAVPYTLPGETVRAEISGRIGRPVEITDVSPLRAKPLCPHFGLPGAGCGGCHLQHLGLAASLDWKLDRLRDALEQAGLDVPEIETHQSTLRSRRRARLAMIRTGKGWQIGFRQWRQHQIVGMKECHILAPELFHLVKALAGEAHRLLPVDVKSAELLMTLTDMGVDADISGVGEDSLELSHREALAEFAAMHDLARLTLDGVPMAQARAPQMQFGGVPVSLPSGSFLQATADGQSFLTGKVLKAIDKASRVADLFSGLGTFALPASRDAQVLAVDSDGPAIAALTMAARRTRRLVDTATRDLFDLPLSVKELAGFEAVILDPPRAGAEAQARALSQSAVPLIVSVSCHPVSFARDTALLSERYQMTSLALLDQFLFSPHIEMVGVFRLKEV